MDRAPESPEAPTQLDEPRMSLLEHLQELRLRLRNSVLVLVGAAMAASFFAERFFFFLARPVYAGAARAGSARADRSGSRPAEGFWVQFKLSLVLGLAVALPLIFWELWKFVAPGPVSAREEAGAGDDRRHRRLLHRRGGVRLHAAVEDHPPVPARHGHPAAPAPGATSADPPQHVDHGERGQLPDHHAARLRCRLRAAGRAGAARLAGAGVGARGMWRFNKYALVLAAVGGAAAHAGQRRLLPADARRPPVRCSTTCPSASSG